MLRLRFKLISDLRARNRPAKNFKKPKDYAPMVSFAINDYYESFLSRIPFLFSGISSGLTQVVTFRWRLAPNIKSNANQIDFGQIIPLLLIALPVLAAAELYYEPRPRCETSIQRVEAVNSRPRDEISGRTNRETDQGSSVPNDPLCTAPPDPNNSRSEQLNNPQANDSATIYNATSGRLSLAMISTDVVTLYKKTKILGMLRIQFVHCSLLMIGAGVFINFVAFFFAALLCTVSILWLVPHVYKVSSYVSSVRTQLQTEFRKFRRVVKLQDALIPSRAHLPAELDRIPLLKMMWLKIYTRQLQQKP